MKLFIKSLKLLIFLTAKSVPPNKILITQSVSFGYDLTYVAYIEIDGVNESIQMKYSKSAGFGII